jgi:hypothetical protein
VSDVLAGSAGDLEHQALRRHVPAKNIDNGLSVAGRSRSHLTRIGNHFQILTLIFRFPIGISVANLYQPKHWILPELPFLTTGGKYGENQRHG